MEIYWGEVIFSFLFLNKYAVPLLKQKTLEKYPEVETLMSKFEPYLTDEVMQEINYQVDEVGKSPEEVAKEFLLTNNCVVVNDVRPSL